MVRRNALIPLIPLIPFVLALGVPGWTAEAAERLPNFVIILIDDMGYADIGAFARGYQTPHLDRMAKEGRVFTDFYVTQAVCSASGLELMTGCYNVRVGIHFRWPTSPIMASAPAK